jgi:hypothetical protein
MTTYRWVRHVHDNEMKLYEVGILPDGTLHNPRGYPDDIVRASVLAADERCHQRRSEAAKKAGETRRLRQARLVYEVAALIIKHGRLAPCSNCRICGKALDDPQSIERAIGSECWQHVLSEIARLRQVEVMS